jgi:tRNA dimethylallyltransferase
MRSRDPRPILIAGPTASGKSALAMQLARERGGLIVNADSMQVYRELRILTARPSPEDEAALPHRLYGHVSALEAYSVARWLEDVAGVLAEARASGATAIVVGGTGLYFKALLEGLSPIPEVPAEVRAHWRQTAIAAAPGELHAALRQRDPVMAARLAPGDTQRITRALEVIEATGRSLAAWQELPGAPLLHAEEAERIVVAPPRDALVQRADRRFDQMIAMGAVEEVARLDTLPLRADATALRALGVPHLRAHLAGTMALEVAIAAAKLATRHYIKRQETWLRRNMSAWNVYDPQ